MLLKRSKPDSPRKGLSIRKRKMIYRIDPTATLYWSKNNELWVDIKEDEGYCAQHRIKPGPGWEEGFDFDVEEALEGYKGDFFQVQVDGSGWFIVCFDFDEREKVIGYGSIIDNKDSCRKLLEDIKKGLFHERLSKRS